MKIRYPLHQSREQTTLLPMKMHEKVKEQLIPKLIELQIRLQGGAVDSPVWIPASSTLSWMNSLLGIRS